MFSRGRRTLLSFRLLESLWGGQSLRYILVPAGTGSCFQARSRTTSNCSAPPVPMLHLHSAHSPSPSYLEIRDGRREEPEEKETTPLFSVCPPNLGSVPPALSDPGPSRKGFLKCSALALGPGVLFPVLSPATWDVAITCGYTREHLSEMTCSAQPCLLSCCSPRISPPLPQPPSAPYRFVPTFGLLLFPADQAGHQSAERHQGAQGKPSSHDNAKQWHLHSGGQESCRSSFG